MPSSRLLIDANLLVLLVVGMTARRLVSKHKRLREFSEDDYDLLTALISAVDEVVVTPNTLTEASNLLKQHRDPERSRFLDGLKAVIKGGREITVPSADASDNPAFRRLGLADAAILEIVSKDTKLLTVDLDLWKAASSRGSNAAENFWHLKAQEMM